MDKATLLAGLAALLVVAPAAGALDLASTTDALRSNWIVGFLEIPQDVRDGHYGPDRVVSVNDAIAFAVVETLDPVGLQARAALDPNVRYIEEDAEVAHIEYTPNDTFFAGYQYDVKSGTTNIVAAWDRSLGSTAVKVAVADTGFRSTFEDLVGICVSAQWDFVYNDGTANDANGHGTHVATTIFAKINNAKGIAGISQSCGLFARVLNGAGSGTCSQISNGITWAGDHGAHVLSMSLGGGACTTEQNAVSYTQGKGTLIIAAAGNSGPCSNCVSYPAAYSGVVAVSCTTSSNALCSFSSTGPQVFIAAPGYQTPGGYPNSGSCGSTPLDRCYVLLSGTSMSTPHVSGVAALIKSTHSTYSASSIKSTLQTTAQDLGAAGRDNNFGYGLLKGSGV
jgi:subtilisin family serine protease